MKNHFHQDRTFKFCKTGFGQMYIYIYMHSAVRGFLKHCVTITTDQMLQFSKQKPCAHVHYMYVTYNSNMIQPKWGSGQLVAMQWNVHWSDSKCLLSQWFILTLWWCTCAFFGGGVFPGWLWSCLYYVAKIRQYQHNHPTACTTCS